MWEFNSIVIIEQNLAGKYIARVLLANNGLEQGAFFQFDSAPDDAAIMAAANKYCEALNGN